MTGTTNTTDTRLHNNTCLLASFRIERSIRSWTPAALQSAIGEHLRGGGPDIDMHPRHLPHTIGDEKGRQKEEEEDEQEQDRQDSLRSRYTANPNAVAVSRRAKAVVLSRDHILWPCYVDLHRATQRFR